MGRQPEDTPSSLLHRLQARDTEGWFRFVNIYAPLIYDWTRMQGVPASDAEDIVQEVLSAVSTNLKGFRRDRQGATFRKWLWGICYHKVMDFMRDRQARASAHGGTSAYLRMQ